MNLGLRYDRTPAREDRYRGMFNVKIECAGVDDAGIDESCGAPTLVRPGEGDFHDGLNVHMAEIVPLGTGDSIMGNHATVVTYGNDFAPRVGLSWQPMDKMTVRAGFGIFYAQDTGNPVFDMGRNLGFRESARSLDLRPTSPLAAPWA